MGPDEPFMDPADLNIEPFACALAQGTRLRHGLRIEVDVSVVSVVQILGKGSHVGKPGGAHGPDATRKPWRFERGAFKIVPPAR